MATIPAGTWVQIEETILPPAERAPQVPADTRAVPLAMKVKGFLLNEAEPGNRVTIRTLSGRLVEGRLADPSPAYIHGFGATVPELQSVGLELRRFMSGGERSNG